MSDLSDVSEIVDIVILKMNEICTYLRIPVLPCADIQVMGSKLAPLSLRLNEVIVKLDMIHDGILNKKYHRTFSCSLPTSATISLPTSSSNSPPSGRPSHISNYMYNNSYMSSGTPSSDSDDSIISTDSCLKASMNTR